MSGIKNIILETRAEELENMLSPFIREQFPNFIRTDYPKLVLFIKAYYEWMEQQGNAGYIVSNMDTIYDIDANSDEFYDHFKRTYLASFPELFAVNPDGKTPNKKTLLKKIRDFYGNKGTESAYKFLFRILYDSDLEVYYPKTDVLKASDGQWIEPRSIKTTSGNGSNLFGGKNGQIYQYEGTQLVASAFINSVVQYSFNGLPVTEFFITDINGTFTPDQTVIISKDGSEWSETAYSVLGQFFIELPGNGYRIGDTVTVTDSRGVGFAAKIEQTGLAGSIKKIGISNSGLNYSGDVLVNIFSEDGAQSAKVFALRSAVTNYAGYFSGNRGKVSSNKKIQDGHYYQDFSYELKSEVSLDTYFDVLKKIIHPAGMRMFGSVLVKKAIDNTVTSSAQATYSEIPVVGRYAPYAFRTFNDLRGGYFLPNQVKGATLQVWLSGYNIAGNTTDGMTADWGYYIREKTYDLETGELISPENWGDVFFGIRHWTSLVGGHTFSHWADLPNTNYWLTPNAKREAVNTHFSVDFMPVNYRFAARTPTGTPWTTARNLGFSGPTVGALGLSAARSYFAVVKPGRVSATSMGTVAATNNPGSFVLCDNGAISWSSSHGIVIGFTGGGDQPKLVAFNRTASDSITVEGEFGATGEWRLISHTYAVGSGNSGPMSLFLDGVSLATQESVGVPATSIATGNLMVGVRRFGSIGAFDGEIAEILCYQGDVGESDRQKIEGYLAHKYGLADNLPVAHPYKNTVPGGSYSSGEWYGTTGDFYPNGYNPYIGSTAQTGVDGTTAPLGSQFLDSGLGYTYTVCDEFGVTAHNPTGSPLGGTAAWYANAESNLTPQGMNGLVLWLKPENIGVCGSVVDGASVDVWQDASPSQNHAIPPDWSKWSDDVSLVGVTIDKLRPTLVINDNSVTGATGVYFNDGSLTNSWSIWRGATNYGYPAGITLGGLGVTFAPGTTGEKLLTARHLWLQRGLTLSADCDIFIVFRTDTESSARNYAFIGSWVPPKRKAATTWEDAIIQCRSWNAIDRNPASQNSTSSYSFVSGQKAYYDTTSPLSFSPWRGGISLDAAWQGTQVTSTAFPVSTRETIAYDPHVSIFNIGRVVGEVGRYSSNVLFGYLNGDRAINRSRSTGLGVRKSSSNSLLSENPQYVGSFVLGRLGAYIYGPSQINVQDENFGSDAWVTAWRSASVGLPFRGVINEVIVFDRALSESERQEVYGYLSRKYGDLESKLPEGMVSAHPSAQQVGATYWEIQHHPNTKNTDALPHGFEFAGIPIRNMMTIPDEFYKSSGTKQANGTVLSGDTYSNVGL